MAGWFSDDYNLNNLSKITTKRYDFDLFVTPRFKERYTDQAYEEMTARLVRQNAKGVNTFIDIGAHYGFFDVLVGLSNPKCTILAFEPVPENCEILRKNLELNNVKAVVYQAAVSDQSGRTTFKVSESSDNSGFIANPSTSVIKNIETDMVQIDQYLAQIPDGPVMVKVNSEGHEIKVLDGMKGLAEQCEDLRLVIEFNPVCLEANGDLPQLLLDKIDDLGFDVFFLNDKELRFEKYHSGLEWCDILSQISYINLFCIRKHRSLSLCIFSHSAELGGAERSILELADSLTTKYGVVCTVVLPYDGPLVQMLNEQGAATLITSYSWWCAEKLPSIQEVHKLMQNSYENNSQVFPLIKMSTPDIVLTTTLVIPWGAVSALALNRPHIWWIKEFGELDHGLEFFLTFQKTLEIIEEASNHILVNSDAVREALFKNTDPEKCTVSIDSNITLPEKSKYNQKIFGYHESIKLVISGTVARSKGQDDAIHAVRKLLHEGYNVELCILGDAGTPFGQGLEELVKDEGLVNRIHFVDFVENVRGVIDQADIGLTCSRNEAFGRVTVEAMLMGKPVIGTNTGGTVEIIDDGVDGFLYSPGDVDQLAEKIAFFVEHPEEIREFGERAIESASRKLVERPVDEYVFKISHANKGTSNPHSTQLAKLIFGWQHGVFAKRGQQLQALTEQLTKRDEQVQAFNTKLREITVSKAWRATMLLRRTRYFLLPPGSWRARLAKKMFSLLLFPFRIRHTYRIKRFLRLIRTSGYFDRGWYLTHNPDVVEASVDPARHYLLNGGFEGRDPGPNFTSQWYLETYPDVQSAGINPLVHYIRFGQREGRIGKPDLITYAEERNQQLQMLPLHVQRKKERSGEDAKQH